MTQPAEAYCQTWGHERMPAAAIGIFDDGEERDSGVAYCGDCTEALIRAGQYRVTRVLDPDAFATRPCPDCGGTGQVPRLPA